MKTSFENQIVKEWGKLATFFYSLRLRYRILGYLFAVFYTLLVPMLWADAFFHGSLMVYGITFLFCLALFITIFMFMGMAKDIIDKRQHDKAV